MRNLLSKYGEAVLADIVKKASTPYTLTPHPKSILEAPKLKVTPQPSP